MEKKEKKINLHKGHRIRTKESYAKNGIDALPPHVVLELLLFFGIPYKDTNPIAHSLINKFGDLSSVFEADLENLKSVKNMTNNASLLIKLVGDISRKYYVEKNTDNSAAITFDKIKNYLLGKYVGVTKETVFLLLFDKNNKLIDSIKINEGYTNVCEVKLGEIVKITNQRNVNKIALCHNHPDGKKISSNDIISTKKMVFHLKMVDITLLESFIVSGNEVMGICKSGHIR